MLNPHVDPPALLDDALGQQQQEPPQPQPQPEQEQQQQRGGGDASPSTLPSPAVAASPTVEEEAQQEGAVQQQQQEQEQELRLPPADCPSSCGDEEGAGAGGGGGLLVGLARGLLGLSGRFPAGGAGDSDSAGGGGGNGSEGTNGHDEGTREQQQQPPPPLSLPQPPLTQRPRPLELPPPLSVPSSNAGLYPATRAAASEAILPPALLRSLVRASWGKPGAGGEEEGPLPLLTMTNGAPFRLPRSETRRSAAPRPQPQAQPQEQAPAVPVPQSSVPAAAASTARVQDLAGEFARMGVPDARWKLSRINDGYEVRCTACVGHQIVLSYGGGISHIYLPPPTTPNHPTLGVPLVPRAAGRARLHLGRLPPRRRRLPQQETPPRPHLAPPVRRFGQGVVMHSQCSTN